jgi:hypothetical protein
LVNSRLWLHGRLRRRPWNVTGAAAIGWLRSGRFGDHDLIAGSSAFADVITPAAAPKIAQRRDEEHQPKSKRQPAAESGRHNRHEAWSHWAVARLRLVEPRDLARGKCGGLTGAGVGEIFAGLSQVLGPLADDGQQVRVIRPQTRDMLKPSVNFSMLSAQRHQ